MTGNFSDVVVWEERGLPIINITCQSGCGRGLEVSGSVSDSG